jgi:glycosyltransferase involved in cell wall biosynthesis
LCGLDGGSMVDKRLTVLQMLPTLESGGVEKGTLEVAKALVENGHRSLVISAGGRMVQQLETEGSEHFVWHVDKKSLFTLRFIWKLRRFLKAQSVDVLHYRSRVPGWVAYLAWKGMNPDRRPRLISTVHGLHSVSAYSAVMTKGERVIAVSETIKKYIAENYPNTAKESIELIYRGVDPMEFPYGYQPDTAWLAQWKNRYPQLTGKFVVALPGRMTRLKGHHDFLLIIRRLKDQGKDVVGLVVGGEDVKRKSYADEIYQSVADMALSDDIVFTGQRTDMKEIYSQCDAVLSLSSKPESFGRTVLEALSLGRPVIGYDHGGVGEILTALYPEGRVPLGDVDAVVGHLSQSLTPVAENHRFLKDNMLDRTLKLYQSSAGKSC